MGNVVVLSTRVRVEEKQLLAALAGANVPAVQLSPEPDPLPLSRAGATAAVLAPTSEKTMTNTVVVDRMQNRTLGGAAIRSYRAMGATVIDSGVAATGNRLDVLHALAAAGLPLPPAMLAMSEQAGLAAIDRVGYPATVFPMQIGISGIALQDRDIAEAVLEHRETLGGSAESVFVVQAGIHDEHDLVKAIVVDGTVIAYEGECRHPKGFSGCAQLAVAAAKALDASFVGVTLAHTPDGLVVWDVRPVPEFRNSLLTGTSSVAEAVGMLVQARLAPRSVSELISRTNGASLIGVQGMGSDIVLSA